MLTLTPGDAAETLTAVGFGNFPFGGNTFQFIMALDGSGSQTPTPEPAPAVMLLFTLAAFAFLRKRSKA